MSRSFQRAMVFAVLPAIAFALSACNQQNRPGTPQPEPSLASVPPRPELPRVPAPAVPAPAPVKQAQSAPSPASTAATADAKPDLYKNALLNPDLAVWREDKPFAWHIIKGKRSSESPTDGSSVELEDVVDRWTRVQQSIPTEMGKEFLGKIVSYWAYVKAQGKDMVAVEVAWKVKGKPGRHYKPHTGDGKWQRVASGTQIPADADPDSIVVSVFRRPGTEGTVLVDSAGIKIVKEK